MAAMRVAAFGDHSEMVEVGRAGISSPTQVTLVVNPRLLGQGITCSHPCGPETWFSEGTPEEMHS